MSEKMTPIDIDRLLKWITTEYNNQASIFGVFKAYKADKNKTLKIFSEKIETPVGPAAGPNTQLAQNIVAAYVAGARFFELKTVQILDGDDLAKCISRPCIKADDEGYNCEWSTELYVPQAYEEYVKAWCILKVISKAYGFGSPDGFVFNMSVGYDLDGIKSDKIDTFIEQLKDASNTEIFAQCKTALKKYFPDLSDYIDNISPNICTSVTLSTLHGCPPDEIERIATYLITEKKLNTYVKCNPTILGYEAARSILDSMGYDYIVFDDHHFKEDLQYSDAVSMFKRLMKLSEDNSLEFGLKLSNTFPVDVDSNQLPSEEMYMSGKALFPLTIEMASRISREFGGKLRLSFSGGAEYFNIDKLFEAGIWPITVATTILKPGGYMRFKQLVSKLESCEYKDFDKVCVEKVSKLSCECRSDVHHVKALKPHKSRKTEEKVPLMDCFFAPCQGGCPIGQDIPEYITLCEKGMYKEALYVITQKNPLPFITGTICAHNCMSRCTRNFYDSSVKIRKTKLLAAENGFYELISEIKPSKNDSNKKVAIIGAGPAGLSAAYFIARSGIEVTVFEKESKAGGIVRNVIPEFRISDEAIDKDVQLVEKMGARILTNTVAPSVCELKSQGYTHILFAVGAYKASMLDIDGNILNVIQFLHDIKAGKKLKLGKNIAIIGGGNTAMDAARAAKRIDKVEKVTIVYRRTKRFMPADEEELELAVSEGVEFVELASPKEHKAGVLICSKMKLGEPDSSNRRRPVETDEKVEIKADTVICAIGEKVDTDIFTENAITPDENGNIPFVTNIEGVYNIGDSLRGPSTVVSCIADAQRFADIVIGRKHTVDIPIEAFVTPDNAKSKKAILCDSARCEGDRCLHCNTVCENCVDVCPNRANVVITLPDTRRQILHIDQMCNECGNCNSFCPYNSAPYKDKFTLFSAPDDFNHSDNKGFAVLNKTANEKKVMVRLDDSVREYDLNQVNGLDKDIKQLILTVINDYDYLIN